MEQATVFDIDRWHERLGIALIINDGEVIDAVIEKTAEGGNPQAVGN